MKVKVNYIPVTTQTREPLMDNGTIDLLIGTYTINDERKASYAISNPYYHDQIGFLVLKDSGINKISDLNGKTIGVAQGHQLKPPCKNMPQPIILSSTTFNLVLTRNWLYLFTPTVWMLSQWINLSSLDMKVRKLKY